MPDINSVKDIADMLYALAEFFFMTIVIKYIIVKWVAEQTKHIFMRIFVASEREMAVWLHYKERGKHSSHQGEFVDCGAGQCAKF